MPEKLCFLVEKLHSAQPTGCTDWRRLQSQYADLNLKDCTCNKSNNCKSRGFLLASVRDSYGGAFITQWTTETILRMKNKDCPNQCEKRGREDFVGPTGAQSMQTYTLICNHLKNSLQIADC